MDLYRLLSFAHLLFAVVLVGLALFWFIMLVALRQRFDTAETKRLLQVVNGARWPHVVVPYSLRLALPWVTWAVLAVLVASGVAILSFRGISMGAWWWAKMNLLLPGDFPNVCNRKHMKGECHSSIYVTTEYNSR